MWRAAVADTTAEVDNMQQLIGNLGRVKPTVALNTHATVLLMPSQAFMKRTLEAHPLITNDALIREVEKAANVYARYYVHLHYRILHRTGSNGVCRLLWDALSLSTSSRLYISA